MGWMKQGRRVRGRKEMKEKQPNLHTNTEAHNVSQRGTGICSEPYHPGTHFRLRNVL